MKALVNLAKCQGYANCIVEAPEVFDLDEDTNKAIVLVDEIAPELEDEARRAADSCPVQAITIEP